MNIRSSLQAISSVAVKEFIHIYRDWRILVLVLILPPVFTLIFGHDIERIVCQPSGDRIIYANFSTTFLCGSRIWKCFSSSGFAKSPLTQRSLCAQIFEEKFVSGHCV